MEYENVWYMVWGGRGNVGLRKRGRNTSHMIAPATVLVVLRTRWRGWSRVRGRQDEDLEVYTRKNKSRVEEK